MSELTSAQREALAASGCEFRTDKLSRCLYAVDASIHRLEPAAVAYPRSAEEASAVLGAAAESGIEITPRGAGTGLAGGALGSGLVVDLARYNRRITQFDRERGTVRVGAGVVLDQLNRFLAHYGLWFGPDVATASRATLGGMIGNNSSGAHSPIYGTTVDHVETLEVVLADGATAVVGREAEGFHRIREQSDRIVVEYSQVIAQRMPAGLVKRWPGYGLDRALVHPGDLSQLITGSEGTLAAVCSAVLRVVPMPLRRSLGVLFFASVEEALHAGVELSDLAPAAVEHIDRAAFDQTRNQRAFSAARDFLGLDQDTCEALLLVEFFDDDGDRLAELQNRSLGTRCLVCADEQEQELVWGIRRAGLSLLTSRKGTAKPTGGIEDVCVRPERLPEYVAGLREILDPLGLEASFYGHAASGELHVRPILDLHTEEDLYKLRTVAEEVADLCRRFSGSLAAEHGVGMARTEFLVDQLGPEVLEAMRRIKELFDPNGVMNPGKIFDDGRYRIDTNLRLGRDSDLQLPFVEAFSWISRDDSFVDNLEQCNGCGGCRKDVPTMCPTYVATGEEAQSTRGRATTIRAALERRFESASELAAEELAEVLDSCLACKACKTECPSNVDLAMLKAELLHAEHRERGVPLLDRVIASADVLGRFGTLFPGLANAALGWGPMRRLAERFLGLDAGAPIPEFTRERFDHWFCKRPETTLGERGPVILWDDTWMRYHEPCVGRAAVVVLEHLGYRVALEEDRVCCGRPAASRGLLDRVRRQGEHNLRLFTGGTEPIIFLEPSCWSIFVDEYRQLEIPGAEEVAARCVLFEDFLFEVLDEYPTALQVDCPPRQVAVHGHCHSKALAEPRGILRLGEFLPGLNIDWLETGCCGMAGAFGMIAAHRALSHKVAAPLVAAVNNLEPDTIVVTSGTSCRHQIAHLTDTQPQHIAELLAILIELDRPQDGPR